MVKHEVTWSNIATTGAAKSKCFYSSYSSGKDVLALFHHFQDCYSNSDLMRHVTKYCNMIGLHGTVRRDGLYTQFTRLFPYLRKWVWLARLYENLQYGVDTAFLWTYYMYVCMYVCSYLSIYLSIYLLSSLLL